MKKYIIIGTVIIIFIGTGYFWYRSSGVPSYSTIIVKRDSILQEVSASGNVVSPNMINLQFQNSGKLTFVGVKVGNKVNIGKVVARQDTSILKAQLRQSQAAYSVAQTSYDKLVNGLSTSDIEIAKVALNNAQSEYNNVVTQQKTFVANALSLMLNSNLIARSTINGANVADLPVVSGIYNNTEEGDYIISTYATGNGAYFSVSGLENGSGQVSTVAVPLGTRGLFIQFPNNVSFFGNATWKVSIPNTQSPSYLTYHNAYQSALQNQSQVIATAQGVIDTAKATLDQRQAKARSEDLAMAKAQIEQTEANIVAIEAQIAEMELVSPINGTITKVDGDVGEIISPSVVIVSILPETKLQIDVNLSEDNVANVKIDDPVSISLDAFLGTKWKGVVAQIDPAQTNIGGSVYYKTTVVFDQTDVRIKAGMTANVLIETGSAINALVLPLSAIQTNEDNIFVKILKDKKIINQNIKTGVKSQDGMVEIISGVTEGQQIIISSQ